jgi:hypothetical protein
VLKSSVVEQSESRLRRALRAMHTSVTAIAESDAVLNNTSESLPPRHAPLGDNVVGIDISLPLGSLPSADAAPAISLLDNCSPSTAEVKSVTIASHTDTHSPMGAAFTSRLLLLPSGLLHSAIGASIIHLLYS